MSDKLQVTYTDVQAAAAAMAKASSKIQSALSALKSNGKLDADAFSDKGQKFAGWYTHNLSGSEQALTESHHSFDVLDKGLRHTAAVYALVDALESKNATFHGPN